MSANRRRHANALPLLSLATWVVVAAFVCAAGLSFVYCKNQLHRSGQETKKLEKELAALETEREVARSKIALLSSRAELQRKLNSGFIKLVPIPNDRMVRISNTPAARGAGEVELRAVTNEGSAP